MLRQIGMLFSLNSLAVPPVERISTPKPCNACANSRMPFLSETLMSALLIIAMLGTFEKIEGY